MMIDVHAHFMTDRAGRADWDAVNARRLNAGERMGITFHVASILGTWGQTSPTYFPSPSDVTHANESMTHLVRTHPNRIRGYCVVNPNYTEHALAELERHLGNGLIGVKLAASRRADDPLLDAVAGAAAGNHAPVLHHIWQHRRTEWPGQEASDAVELVRLAVRHPRTAFILAHIGGGGDWAHSLRAVTGVTNIYVDLSGSGVDAGMLESVVDAVGPDRMLWGCDVTMDTGLAKLRYLSTLGLPDGAMERITAGNARRIFPPGAFDA